MVYIKENFNYTLGRVQQPDSCLNINGSFERQFIVAFNEELLAEVTKLENNNAAYLLVL